MIGAVIFDMDGLLVDSEPLWRKAEKEVFAGVGVHLQPHMFEQMMGYRIEEVIEHWRGVFGWEGPENEAIRDQIIDRMLHLIKTEAAPLPGVNYIFDFFNGLGLPMAIASSSNLVLINAVVDKLGIRSQLKFVHSAEHEPYGKPHPQVFLSAADMLKTPAPQCLVFEDSFNGVLAAKAARMKTVAIPEPGKRNDSRFCIADLVLDSLHDFSKSEWEFVQ